MGSNDVSRLHLATVQGHGIEVKGIAGRLGATAVGEEVAFRGFMGDLMGQARWGAPRVIAVDVVAVTLWHIPSMLAGSSLAPVGTFAALLLLGLILCILRLATRSLLLPAAADFAVDIF